MFNAKPCIEEVTIKYSQCSFFNKMKKSVEKDRRGEVVLGVIRPSGKVIAVTCAEYPEGVFRIPTGGIAHNENIAEAVFRETKEELGSAQSRQNSGGSGDRATPCRRAGDRADIPGWPVRARPRRPREAGSLPPGTSRRSG